MTELLESIQRLDKDLVDAIRTGKLTMTRADIRYMVDLYYQLQDFRKASANQDRASTEIEEPTRLVSYVFTGMRTLENQVKRAMDAWTETSPVSRWAKRQMGIGPVLSAGLAAHIDIEQAPTVGHIWRFAGLDPTCIWLGREKATALVKELAKKKSGEIKEPELSSILEQISQKIGTKPGAIRKKALLSKVTVESLTKAAMGRVPSGQPETGELVALEREKAEKLLSELSQEMLFLAELLGKKNPSEIKEPDLSALIDRVAQKIEIESDVLRERATLRKVTVDSLAKATARKPWNARLKTLCWKIGDSFVKVHNKPGAFYGLKYAERKAQEVAKNEKRDFRDQAEQKLRDFKIQDKATKKVYEDGRLPDGRIDLRARRHAVKIFLAHWHREAYFVRYGKEPPLPYPIAQMGHTHVITAPSKRTESEE